MLLETPAHRDFHNDSSKDADLKTYRLPSSSSYYNDEYKQELSNSLRNRSTTKKLRCQRVIDKSILESYRQKDFRVDSVINEEDPRTHSDDENE